MGSQERFRLIVTRLVVLLLAAALGSLYIGPAHAHAAGSRPHACRADTSPSHVAHSVPRSDDQLKARIADPRPAPKGKQVPEALGATEEQGEPSTPDDGGDTPGFSGQSLTFRRLTLEDGLSQSSIYCTAQDARGFMWFGTEDGLNRYDGYEIKAYQHNPDDPHSLSNNWIIHCEADQRNVLWVFTSDGVVHRYEPETGHFIRYHLEMEDPFQRAGQGFTAVHGDEHGGLWIGTFGSGLLRYNPAGDVFTSYRHDPDDPTTLSHRCVWTIYEDRQGTVWVGTEGGLNRYDEESDGFFRYPYRDFPPGGYQYDPPVHAYDPAFQPDNPDAMASPAVTQMLEDAQGRLWIGTRYGGLNQLDPGSATFTTYPYDPAREPANPNTFSGNSVHGLLEDGLGQIWVSSADWNVDETRTYARLGLERLDPETRAITRYQADPEDPCSLPHDATLLMFEDSQGRLWIHTFGGGVEVYDRARDCFVHYGHDPKDARSLSGDSITDFFEDEAGGLWIGTAVNGVNLHDPTWAKFPSYRLSAPGSERLSNNSILAFGGSPKRMDGEGRFEALWISTYAGLNYWDRRTGGFTFYEIDPKLPDIVASAVLEDAERDTLWLATSMGLERAALPADTSDAPQSLDVTRVITRSSAGVGSVLDLHPAGPDQLWLAQYGVGLVRFDLGAEQIIATYGHDPTDEQSLADDRVSRIYPGQDGTLWLVTRSGVAHFDPRTEVFDHILHDPEDPESVAERVLSLYEDRTGAVWLGTQGGGLQQVDPSSGQVTATYREEEGLPNNVVYAVLPDQAGQLWLSTNQGLARFDPATETFQIYTYADGLQSNEFNHLADFRAPDGELFFGGVSGFNAFHPEAIAPNPYVPPVLITGLRLGPPQLEPVVRLPGSTGAAGGPDKGVERKGLLEAPPYATEAIVLSHQDRVLSFKFAALHYALPERNQYAYLLEGFDSDWNYVGNQRTATYTNLPPGRYVFRVKASNSDGVWNDAGASLTVTVRPPFWATWWFRGIIALLIVGGAIGGYRLRVGSIQARSRELEREVASRTKELASLNAIGAAVSRSLDLDEVLSDALDETLDVMGIEAGGIYLLDKEAEILSVVAQRGFSADFVNEIDELRVGEGFSGRVAQSGEPLVVRNVSEDPRLTRLLVQEEGLHSLAVVPLGAKGKVLGTLFVITRGYREFSDRDVQLLVSIAQQIGVAVEKVALYEDTRSRLAQLTALQETTMAVASTLELQRLLRLIIQQAIDLLEAGGGILNLVDWEAWEDEVVAATGSARPSLGRRSSLESSLSGWATLNRQAAMSNQIPEDHRVDRPGLRWLEAETGQAVRNAAVAPLLVKDQALGTLAILDKQGGQASFEQSDLDLLQSFANQAATAIENARLFEAEQRRAEQFRGITEVGRRISSVLDLHELLRAVVQLIKEIFGYYNVNIFLVDAESGALVLQAGLGGYTDDRPPLGSCVGSDGEGIVAWIAATGEPLLVNDVTSDPRYFATPALPDTRSELGVPIDVRGETVGTLDVQSTELNAFDRDDLVTLQNMADQIGIAVENARLFEAVQRRAEQFRVISEVGRHITSITSIDSVLQQVVDLIQSAFNYDHVGIAMIDDGMATYRVGAGKLWSDGAFEFSPAHLKVGEEGITGWVAGTGEPLLVPDVRQEPLYVWMRGSSTRSELAVPIKFKEKVIGVLDGQSDQLNAFDESDIMVLEALADQAAIAIENARLYEQAQRLAVVEERQRLARELHDSVTQALYGATLYAEAASRQLATGQLDLASEHLGELRDTAQEALREMRLLIFELRPSVLESEGLRTALRARLEAVEERAGLEVAFQVRGERALPSRVEEGLYRIAQEALNNALKHACAQKVTVSLELGGRVAVMEIVDDGCGFDPETAVEGGGLGLDGMIERAAQMGGELALESQPGAGTRVRVEVLL